MKIRKGKISDAKELLNLLNKTPELQGRKEEKIYTLQFILGCLKYKNRNLVLIVEEKKTLIGFLIAEIWKEKKYSFMCDIFVKPEFRNRDIATKLQREYENYCKKLGLRNIVGLVLITNKKMQNWCKKHKFARGNKFYYYEKRL